MSSIIPRVTCGLVGGFITLASLTASTASFLGGLAVTYHGHQKNDDLIYYLGIACIVLSAIGFIITCGSGIITSAIVCNSNSNSSSYSSDGSQSERSGISHRGSGEGSGGLYTVSLDD